MGLTNKQLSDVCLIYGGVNQCRYLDEDFDAHGRLVHVCLKRSKDKAFIDRSVLSQQDMAKKLGVVPDGNPMGDNCKGYLKLPNKKQGYDLD